MNSGDVVVALTYYGDANLDRQVNSTDLSILNASSGTATPDVSSSLTLLWTQGDFSYDGAVDLVDYNLFDRTTTMIAAGFFSSSPPPALQATVTVPAAGVATGTITVPNCPATAGFALQPPGSSTLYTAAPPNGPVTTVVPPASSPYVSISPSASVTFVGNDGAFTVNVPAGTLKGVYTFKVYILTNSPVVLLTTVNVVVTVN